ncbi:MAG: hypothetical protein JNL67_20015 [Planctomycetaceae bacterium]|nr:hypothetical protein [Planctomycetaceae bacterium]
MKPKLLAFYLLLTVVCLVTVTRVQGADDKITFDDHIKPLFNQRCSSCHNPNNKSGDLDVTNFTAMMLGGGSGTVVEAGEPSGSYLFKLITHESSPEMPPDSDRLPDAEIELVRKWIEGGALENQTSKAAPKKKKLSAVSGDASVRPEVVPQPCRLNLDVTAVPHRSPAVMAIANSPWAPVLAVGAPFQVLLFDSQSLQLRGVLPFPEGHIHALRFSRNGGILVAGGGRAASNGVVVAWDIQTGERVIEITGLMDAVLAVDISNDHTRIATGSTDRLVRIFDAASGKQVHEIKKHTDWIQAIEFSPDGVLLASGDRSGGLLVWEAKTAREYLDLRGHQGPITAVSWRLDSNALASGSQDTTIRLWEMENGGQFANWAAHGGGVTSVQYTRDSRIVSGGRDNHAKVFNQGGGQEKAYPWSNIVTTVRLCDETNRVLACDLSGLLKMRDVATDAELGEISLVVPKLEQRLAVATTALEQVRSQHQALSLAATTAREAFTKLDADLQAMTVKKQELVQQRQTAVTQLEQIMTELTSLRAQLASAQEVVNRLGPGLTNLTQAIEAVQRSLATMQSDQLEASLKQLTELKQTNEVQLASNQTVLEQLPAKIVTLEASLTEVQGLQTKLESELATLEPVLAAQQMQRDEAQALVTTRQSEAEQFQPQFDAAVAHHQRLKEAADFARQEQELLAALANQARQIEAAAETEGQAAQQANQLAAAIQAKTQVITGKQQEVATWTQQVTESETAVQELARQDSETKQAIAASKARQSQLQLILDKLQVSTKSLAEALQTAGEDAALQQVQQQLLESTKSKTEALEQEQAQVVNWEASLAEWVKRSAEHVARQAELKTAITQAEQEIARLVAERAPTEQEHVNLMAKLAEHQAQVQREQEAWQAVRIQLMQLRGVTVTQD